jgi:hypothetical protein
MSSNYNGRSRLAELVKVDGEVVLARAPEYPADRVAAIVDGIPLR